MVIERTLGQPRREMDIRDAGGPIPMFAEEPARHLNDRTSSLLASLIPAV
jgi:hypothetical protein